MVPVLLPSSYTNNNSPLSLTSLMVSAPAATSLSGFDVIQPAASPRGRKRTNEHIDRQLFAKRNSNSDLSDDDSASTPRKGSPGVDDERRAHHNELERRRRDHIKDHFMSLKEAIPLLEGEKSSRALILKRAVEYIHLMQTRIQEQAQAMEELKRHNEQLAKDYSSTPSSSTQTITSPAVMTTTTTAPTINIEPISHPVVSAASSFSPVIPSKPAMQLRFPPEPSTMANIAMLLAMNSKQQESQAGLFPKDLASLISFNSLALKDTTAQFVSPLLF